MGYMPDGNSAALRIYEREQARAEKQWDSDADGIAQDWTDNVMEGGFAFRKHWELKDFLEDIDADDLALLIVTTRNEAILERQHDIRKKLAATIKEFFLTHCSEEIWDVIRSER